MADPFLPQFKANEGAAIAPQFFLHEGIEVVRVLKAGDSRSIPVFRAVDVWERGDFGEEITYAERWPDQYRQFKEGSAQTANGTPLEQAPFLNPSRISDLRALKIFSIEGLAQFDDRYIARLGGNGYHLKEMAQDFINKRNFGATTDAHLQDQIAALTARLAEVEGRPVMPHSMSPINNGHDPIPSGWVEMTENPLAVDPRTDEELKKAIADKFGSRPRGTPTRETLLNMLAQESA